MVDEGMLNKSRRNGSGTVKVIFSKCITDFSIRSQIINLSQHDKLACFAFHPLSRAVFGFYNIIIRPVGKAAQFTQWEVDVIMPGYGNGRPGFIFNKPERSRVNFHIYGYRLPCHIHAHVKLAPPCCYGVWIDNNIIYFEFIVFFRSLGACRRILRRSGYGKSRGSRRSDRVRICRQIRLARGIG